MFMFGAELIRGDGHLLGGSHLELLRTEFAIRGQRQGLAFVAAVHEERSDREEDGAYGVQHALQDEQDDGLHLLLFVISEGIHFALVRLQIIGLLCSSRL